MPHRQKRTYLVLSYEGLRGNKNSTLLKTEIQTHKIHRMTKFDTMKGKSDVQIAATIKKFQPTAILLVGERGLERVRPDLDLRSFHGQPFLLDLRRKGVDTALTTPTFHPDKAREKGKTYQLMKDDVDAWIMRSLSDDPLTKNWPDGCAQYRCELLADEFDYEGVGWCHGHWSGPEPPKRVEKLELFDAA